MSQLLTSFGPMIAFMLIPLWIPLLAVAGGWLWELFARPAPSPVAQRLEQLRAQRVAERAAASEELAGETASARSEVELPEAA